MKQQIIDIAKLVEKDIEGRVKKGEAEYGERLRAFNGRDALQDAYEEALDLTLYLKQALIEAKKKPRDKVVYSVVKWVNDKPVLDGMVYFKTKERALRYIDRLLEMDKKINLRDVKTEYHIIQLFKYITEE